MTLPTLARPPRNAPVADSEGLTAAGFFAANALENLQSALTPTLSPLLGRGRPRRAVSNYSQLYCASETKKHLSPAGRGRGPAPLGAGRVRGQSHTDGLRYALDVREDIIVPEAEDAEAFALEVLGSHTILFRGMLATVDLDDELGGQANEIGDIAGTRFLSPEFPAELSVPEMPPELALGVGCVGPQSAGGGDAGSLHFGFSMALACRNQNLVVLSIGPVSISPLTPALSPVGRGRSAPVAASSISVSHAQTH